MKTFFFGDCLKNFCEDVFFWRALAHVSLVLGLGLERSCPWPQEGLSSEELSLALTSDFFVSLALTSSLVFSTPPLENSLAASGCATEHQPSLVIPLTVHFPANPLHDQLSSQNSPCPTCFSIRKQNDLKSLPVALLRMVAP